MDVCGDFLDHGLEAADGVIEAVDGVGRDGAAAAQMSGFELFDCVVNVREVREDGASDGDFRLFRREALPGEGAKELSAKASDVVFDVAGLVGCEVDDIARERGFGFGGVEGTLDLAEQVVDVSAGGSETALLGLIELAGKAVVLVRLRHATPVEWTETDYASWGWRGFRPSLWR